MQWEQELTSIHPLGWGHVVHLLIQGLVDDRTVLEHHLRILHIGLVKEGEGVLHPVLVIAVREVLVRMRTAGLLACLSRVHLLRGLVDQVLELKRLDEVRVPDHAAVGDADILVLLHDAINHVLALEEVVSVAIHRRILLHVDLQLAAEVGCRDWALAVPDLVHASDRSLASIRWQFHWGAVGLHKFGCRVCCLAAKDNQVEQRVRSETVGSMH
mmetsp:Transcript_108872/g.272823  ORF Transcript_108872/g.272823 Transcript_108872/m.272823 type:complete len:214 (-) Transcript_108872:286-927(-)